VRTSTSRRPEWLRVRMSHGDGFKQVKSVLREHGLHTVCEEAGCPNIYECFQSGTATFLILGDQCSRDCGYCRVEAGSPDGTTDSDEPRHVAEAAARLRLEHVVVTSVTRDDLLDGGAAHFATTVREIRNIAPDSSIEVLIPDFQGDCSALAKVVGSGPDVLNHNIETVPRLYPGVRPQADYRRSIDLFREAQWIAGTSGTRILFKSGLMVGLGEDDSEVLEVARDLKSAGVQMITVGQYLQPSRNHLAIERYWTPDEFARLGTELSGMGFSHVEAGPLVRSSYHAAAGKVTAADPRD